MKKLLGLICVILIFNLLNVFSSYSCTTPVFRYALEMWPAFNYKVTIIHNGNLSSEQTDAIELLKKSASGNRVANIMVQETSDFNKYNIQEKEKPQIVLLHPEEHKNNTIIWHGDLTIANVKKIIDSPARQQILKNIQKGDAISWILVESHDQVKNKEASQTLKKEIELLSGKLKLAGDATDVDGKPLDIDIINNGVHFSMISISRDDPAEEVFIQILLSTEPDLPFIKSPLAFPVFGRGRVLYALVGKGIKQKLIETTCNAVIGWCSCTVKEDNPGSDLLFTADWEKVAGDSTWIKAVEIPEITGMSGFINEEEIKKSENKTKVVKPEPVETKKQQKKIVVDSIQSKASTTTESSDVISLKSTETVSTPITDNATSEKNPLRRNIFIVVAILLFALPAISVYLRKKGS